MDNNDDMDNDVMDDNNINEDDDVDDEDMDDDLYVSKYYNSIGLDWTLTPPPH